MSDSERYVGTVAGRIGYRAINVQESNCNSSWRRVISTTLRNQTTEPKGTVFDPVQDRMLDYMNVHDIT
jgi:hypothetical protein